MTEYNYRATIYVRQQLPITYWKEVDIYEIPENIFSIVTVTRYKNTLVENCFLSLSASTLGELNELRNAAGSISRRKDGEDGGKTFGVTATATFERRTC